MRLPSAGVFLGSLVVLGACRSGSNVAPPSVTPPASADAQRPAPKGVPSVHALLDDPRLADARSFEQAKDWTNAAKIVHDARPKDLTPDVACPWDFLEGRLQVMASALPEAISAFERADQPTCVLSGHARLRSAQALARMGRADEAIARAKTVPDDLKGFTDEVKMVIAESLSAKGDRAGALPLWRAWLGTNPHGSRWVDTSVRIASALLDGVDGAPETHAKEAYDAATRVVIEAPKLADSSGATQARLRAVALLRGKDGTVAEVLSESERARQAQGWLEANEPTRAFELATSVMKSSVVGCRAALTRANAAAKKSPKMDAWGDAVTACQNDGELVTALYAGAKARTSKDPKLAIEWFARVEQQFPKHRLADDARFRGALLVASGSDAGREERSEQMLSSLPDDYPNGDMGTEALFRVALAKMSRATRGEDWEPIKPVLDRIIQLAPADRHWATAGRAEYFRARAAEMTGDHRDALSRWAEIIEKRPLSFYMLLSFARLHAADSSLAEKTLASAITKDQGSGAFPSKTHDVISSLSFQRAIRLLEASDAEAARREISSSGATADGAEPELFWIVGRLYNQAGFPELGHAFSRGKVSDHLEHYPEGRWRVPWETAYPRAFEGLVAKACDKYTLPRAIAWGIMREESSFVADAKSPANAFGLMQLIVPTAKGVAIGTGYGADDVSLRRPEVSIELGTKLLSGLRAQHRHNALAIGAYNGGSGAVGRWLNGRVSDELDLFVENVPWEETRNYIKRVLSSVAAYGYLYDRKTFDEVTRLPLQIGR